MLASCIPSSPILYLISCCMSLQSLPPSSLGDLPISLFLDYCLAPRTLAIAHLWQSSLHSVILSLAVRVNVLVSLDYCLARLATALLSASAVEYPVDGNV